MDSTLFIIDVFLFGLPFHKNKLSFTTIIIFRILQRKKLGYEQKNDHRGDFAALGADGVCPAVERKPQLQPAERHRGADPLQRQSEFAAGE